MEEINIIELLKRVKEGKAPKEIQIETTNFTFTGIEPIEKLYENKDGVNWIDSRDICICTKIKILDKPIIEELEEVQFSDLKCSHDIDNDYIDSIVVCNRDKINEIIKWINNKE